MGAAATGGRWPVPSPVASLAPSLTTSSPVNTTASGMLSKAQTRSREAVMPSQPSRFASAPASSLTLASIANYLPSFFFDTAFARRLNNLAFSRLSITISLPAITSSWQGLDIAARTRLLQSAADRPGGSVEMPKLARDKCHICHSKLTTDDVRRRFHLCGPGGTHCVGIEGVDDDSKLREHLGTAAYNRHVRAGTKERWRRPYDIPLAAQTIPCFVQLLGLPHGSQAANVDMFLNCSRIYHLFQDLGQRYPAQQVQPRYFFHGPGHSAAIIAFESREVAEAVVTEANRGGGFSVLCHKGEAASSQRIATVVKAKLLETDEEQVECLQELTSAQPISTRPAPMKPKVSFRT